MPQNARGRRIWTPPSHDRDVISTCLVVVNMEGKTCGAKFLKGQEALVEQHAIKCTAEHGDVMAAWMKQRRPDVQKPWDPEYGSWLKTNKKAIEEGRVKW